jgi:hypothetical protein
MPKEKYMQWSLNTADVNRKIIYPKISLLQVSKLGYKAVSRKHINSSTSEIHSDTFLQPMVKRFISE